MKNKKSVFLIAVVILLIVSPVRIYGAGTSGAAVARPTSSEESAAVVAQNSSWKNLYDDFIQSENWQSTEGFSSDMKIDSQVFVDLDSDGIDELYLTASTPPDNFNMSTSTTALLTISGNRVTSVLTASSLNTSSTQESVILLTDQKTGKPCAALFTTINGWGNYGQYLTVYTFSNGAAAKSKSFTDMSTAEGVDEIRANTEYIYPPVNFGIRYYMVDDAYVSEDFYKSERAIFVAFEMFDFMTEAGKFIVDELTFKYSPLIDGQRYKVYHGYNVVFDDEKMEFSKESLSISDNAACYLLDNDNKPVDDIEILKKATLLEMTQGMLENIESSIDFEERLELLITLDDMYNDAAEGVDKLRTLQDIGELGDLVTSIGKIVVLGDVSSVSEIRKELAYFGISQYADNFYDGLGNETQASSEAKRVAAHELAMSLKEGALRDTEEAIRILSSGINADGYLEEYSDAVVLRRANAVSSAYVGAVRADFRYLRLELSEEISKLVVSRLEGIVNAFANIPDNTGRELFEKAFDAASAPSGAILELYDWLVSSDDQEVTDAYNTMFYWLSDIVSSIEVDAGDILFLNPELLGMDTDSLTVGTGAGTGAVSGDYAAASVIKAAKTTSTTLINGINTGFDAYVIADNNYFKLRDIAFALSDTEKQFEVEWIGEENAISLSIGRAYTTVGGEMTVGSDGTKTPVPTDSKILLNGVEIQMTAYNIDGNNYFKLRDIGEALDFDVDWNAATNAIVINTGASYTE